MLSIDTISVNWNRTFVLPTDAPKAGVLLLHGMSDSPYSLHSLGKCMHKKGAWVIGLRLPGHGTAPSGLVLIPLYGKVKPDDSTTIHLGNADFLREREVLQISVKTC